MGASPLEKYCALRALVEEVLTSLKQGEHDYALAAALALAEGLDEEIAAFGDEGWAKYKVIRENAEKLRVKGRIEGEYGEGKN